MSELVTRIDDLGRPAWIALMVVSFILFWPVGLAVLAFLLWSGRMGCGHHGAWGDPRERWQRRMAHWQDKIDRWGRHDRAGVRTGRFAASGNRAFDEYREETLKRLEDEAQEFRTYLDRLRHARDKVEFDQFMAERRNRPQGPASGSGPEGGGHPENGGSVPNAG
jgi:hypothetical protein